VEGWKWPKPTSSDEFVGQMGQWGAGPPRDKRRVVAEAGSLRRREGEKGEDEPKTGVERRPEVASAVGRQEGEGWQSVPTFEDMEEPMVEIAVWTTAREEALKKVMEEARSDEGELSVGVLDGNRQRYVEMLSNVAARDAKEEEYRKARGIGQPYRGMTRPPWQKGRFTRVAEEIHTVYLQDKWAKMEARNLKRFVTAVGGLSALELTRLGPKPKDALPRRYDADMVAALKQGQVRRLFTGGNAVVWPERYRQVGYYYELEKDVCKLKPRGRAVTQTLDQMSREEVLPEVLMKKEWVEVETWPQFVQDFEGDFTVECYMAMFLMFRNHLGRVWEAA